MKNLLAFGLCLSIFTTNAQDKNQFYALDAKMNQTVLDSSKYILWIHETDSARWQWDYYFTWGSLVKSTKYADHDGTIRDGRFCIYNTRGQLDSTGIYDHGKKSGIFLKFKINSRDSIEISSQSEYVNDSLVKYTNLLSKHADNNLADSAIDKQPVYPGGNSGWQQYIRDNLRYPERAKAKDIQGQVGIYFRVDKDGNITDSYIQKSQEYSLDQEALRLVKNSGKWEPATMNGVPVNAYQSQDLIFALTSK